MAVAARPGSSLAGRHISLLLLSLVLLASAAAPARAAPALPPPIALGGACRLLVSCPWSAPSGAHLRVGGLVWLAQPTDPRPLSLVPSLGLSGSLTRWVEAGVLFTGRGGATQDGGPALLHLPITLWARLSPQIVPDSGLQVAAEVRYAVGRAPFDGGGTAYADSESYALSVGYSKGRFESFLSGAYQEAAGRSYRGLEAGGGVYVLALRSLGLQLGAEALGRIGGEGHDAAPSWTASAVVRFFDEHGVVGAFGSGAGGGPGMPGRMPIAFVFGLSIGPSYKPHPVEPGYAPLLDSIEEWLRERWRRRQGVLPAAGLGAGAPLLPPLGLRGPGRLGRPLSQPSHCGALSGLRGVSDLALRTCHATWDLGDGGDTSSLERAATYGPPDPQLSPTTPTAGPAAPEEQRSPSQAQGIAGGGGPSGGPPTPRRGGMPPRGTWRTGRGVGWEDAEVRAGTPLPGQAPPTHARVVDNGPAIPLAELPALRPVGPQPPAAQPPRASEPLPPGMRPESVPPFLRPPPPAPLASPSSRLPAEPSRSPPPPAGTLSAAEATPLSSAAARGGAGPVRQGQRGVAEVARGQQEAGRVVRGGEVTVQTRIGRRRIDLIVDGPGGPSAIEVKTGGSRYTPQQQEKDRIIATEGGTAVGQKAQAAGVAGPIKVQTEVIRRP